MKLKPIELALIIALVVTFVFSCVSSVHADELSDKLIRFHVVAESDSDSEQSIKLKVRDAVLELLGPKLEDVDSREAAVEIITREKKNIEETARKVVTAEGMDHDVTVTLMEEYYPTRDYETFSLPSGNYLSLRVTIGEGKGHNWWCVVFPNVCFAGQLKRESGAELGLTEDEMSLITMDSGESVIKFRFIELIAELKKILGL